MPYHANIHADPRAHRLIGWQRSTLYWTGALLLGSGAAWLAIHYGIGAGAGELPHPLEAWCLRLHGAVAFGGVFILGVLAGAHVPQGWRLSRRRHWSGQRNTGIGLCAGGALLVLSGYLLYYFAPEGVRPALGWAHSGVGVVMATLIAFHRRGASSA